MCVPKETVQRHLQVNIELAIAMAMAPSECQTPSTCTGGAKKVYSGKTSIVPTTGIYVHPEQHAILTTVPAQHIRTTQTNPVIKWQNQAYIKMHQHTAAQ